MTGLGPDTSQQLHDQIKGRKIADQTTSRYMGYAGRLGSFHQMPLSFPLTPHRGRIRHAASPFPVVLTVMKLCGNWSIPMISPARQSRPRPSISAGWHPVEFKLEI